MSPVKTVDRGYWLRRLGWLAKGEGLGQKSRTLILPPPLAARLGTNRVTELMVRFPYNKIGLPGEVPFPYTEPHVFPTFYRLQVPGRKPSGPQDRVARPICCLSDGEFVFYRKAGLVSAPGFDQAVQRGEPPRVPCVRTASGGAAPCPFAIAKDRKSEPPCTLVGELHLLISYPLPDSPAQRGIELGVYILEVPPSRINDVWGQLSVLRDLVGGQLTGHEFRLVWEATQVVGHAGRTSFYAPRFEMTVPPNYATADQASGVEGEAEVAREVPPLPVEQDAEAAEEIVTGEIVAEEKEPPEAGEQGGKKSLRPELQQQMQHLYASYQGLTRTAGSALPGQRQNIQGLLAKVGITADAAEVLAAINDTETLPLSAAQAAAFVALLQAITDSPTQAAAFQQWWADHVGQ